MNEDILAFVKRPWVLPTATGVLGLAVGGAAGYLFGRREVKAMEKIAVEALSELVDGSLKVEDATKQVDEANLVIERLTKQVLTDRSSGLDEIFSLEEFQSHQASRDIHPSNQPPDEEEVTEDEVEVSSKVTNIFREAKENPVDIGELWDYEVELQNRKGSTPYVIHVDEYMADEAGLDQSTLTYYRGDDILTDSHDVPIYNHAEVTGELKFGYGSNDPNVCYIRNPRLKSEYEILLSHGSYEVEVLGLQFEEELEHSSKRQLPKFREE